MVQYNRIVINKLLDRYESSLLSIGKNERTIHIEWKFNKKNLPVYFDESSGEYEKIHILMQHLEEEQLIAIIWKNNKVGHVISKVRLNIENLERAYGFVKRIPKTDLIDENSAFLTEVVEQTVSSVAKNFANYLLQRLQENKSVKEWCMLLLQRGRVWQNPETVWQYGTLPDTWKTGLIEN